MFIELDIETGKMFVNVNKITSVVPSPRGRCFIRCSPPTDYITVYEEYKQVKCKIREAYEHS